MALTNEKSDKSEPGSLYFSFVVAKFCGLAPVTFQRQTSGYLAVVSERIHKINIVALLLLNSLALAGLLVDLKAGPEKTSRAHTSTRSLVWISELMTTMILVSALMFFGKQRSAAILQVLDNLTKLSSLLRPEKLESKKESLKLRIIILLTTTINLLVVIEFAIFLKSTIDNNRDLISTILYTGYFIYYSIMYASLLLCALVTNKINESMKRLNGILEDILLNICNRHPNKITSIPPHENISHLASTYDTICDQVRQLNRSFGLGYLLFLVALLLRLVVTPYNIIVNIRGEHVNLFVLALQHIWLAAHVATVMILIEPCHRTQQEINRTRTVVGELTLETSNTPVAKELEKFSSYLALNTASYSPVGLCTVSRCLIASMASSVATYLVVICQFQGPDVGEY